MNSLKAYPSEILEVFDGFKKGVYSHLCPGSILLAKIFATVATEIITETIMTNSFINIAKIARVTNVTKFKA